MRKGRAGHKLEMACLLVKDTNARNVAGQQIRRTLEAAKIDAQGYGQGARQHGFAHTGHIFQQNVAFTQQGNHQGFNHFRFADDYLLHIRRNRLDKALNRFHEFFSGSK